MTSTAHARARGYFAAAGVSSPLWAFARALSVVACLAAAPAPATAQAPAESPFFRIATGEIDGPAFAVAGVIAGGLSNPPGARPCDRGGSCGVPGMIAVAQAIGDPAGAVDLLVRNQLEAVLMPADQAVRVYQNRQGRNGEARALLRTVGTVYVEALHLVVLADSAYRMAGDLKGQTLTIAGADASGQRLARQALAQLGLAAVPQSRTAPALSAALDQLGEGQIDAVVTAGAAPIEGLVEIARSMPLRLLGMPEAAAKALIADHRYLVGGTIAAATYAGVMEAEVLGLPTQLYVSADADPNMIYQVTRALWNPATLKLMAAGPPEARDARLDRAIAGLVVPIHPGAARFYRESGILTTVDPAELAPPVSPQKMRGELPALRPAPRPEG